MRKSGANTGLEIDKPKSSLNLAGLKAAFSSHRSFNSGVKSNTSKAANHGPAQQTLKSFMKDTGNPGVKPLFGLTRSLKTGYSALDGFRYGKGTACTDINSKDIFLSNLDNNPSADDPNCDRQSPTFDAEEPSIKKEALTGTTSQVHKAPQESHSQPEATTHSEGSSASPDLKRARKENPGWAVDAPVSLQKRAVPLHFTLQELSGKIKRLRDQKQKRETCEELRYRRFRAKINPGESQHAEEELKKEIR